MSLSPTLAFQFNFCVHLGWVHFVADFSKRFSISSLFFRQFQFPFVSRFWGKCDGSRNLLVIPLFTLFRQLCTVHCFLLTDNCLLFSDNCTVHCLLFLFSDNPLLFSVYCHKSVLYSLLASHRFPATAPDNYFRSHYHISPLSQLFSIIFNYPISRLSIILNYFRSYYHISPLSVIKGLHFLSSLSMLVRHTV